MSYLVRVESQGLEVYKLRKAARKEGGASEIPDVRSSAKGSGMPPIGDELDEVGSEV